MKRSAASTVVGGRRLRRRREASCPRAPVRRWWSSSSWRRRHDVGERSVERELDPPRLARRDGERLVGQHEVGAGGVVLGRVGERCARDGERHGDEPRRTGRPAAASRLIDPRCVELHHEELLGEPLEPERLVQGERPAVVDGGVDEAVVQPARPHPRQRVEREGPPVTAALRGRGDGEALQVALPGRRAADGEADDRLAPRLVPVRRVRARARWVGVARRISARSLASLPHGSPNAARSICDGLAVPAGPQRDRRSTERPGRRPARSMRSRASVSITVKPASAKRDAASREQRAGADRVHGRAVRADLAGQRVDPRADLVDGRDDGLVGERELDDAAVERPRAHAHPRAEAAVVSSNLHRSATVLAAARSPSSLGRS